MFDCVAELPGNMVQGNPCKRGHSGVRYKKENGKPGPSVGCKVVYDAELRAKNAESIKIEKAAYYAANVQSISARASAYRAKNADELKTEKANYRAFKRGAEGKHTRKEIDALYLEQHGKCVYCDNELNGKYHRHITALTKGGTNWISNICLSCQPCNNRKSVLDLKDWLYKLRVTLPLQWFKAWGKDLPEPEIDPDLDGWICEIAT